MHLRHAGTVLPHPLLIVTAVTLTLLLSLGRSGAHADHEPDTALPRLSEIAVDLDTTGNSATSLGPREDCASVGPHDTLQIDVTVKGVPPFDPGTFSGGIAGFGFDLLYDPTVIKVTAVDLDFLHASAGARIPFDIIDPLPDTDGVFRFDSGDLSQNFESGDGVLARIALQAVGTGASILRLAYATSPYYDPDPPAVLDASATIYEVARVPDAAVSVGDLSGCYDVDTDGDAVPDLSDNCPTTVNPDQVNTDSDGFGNACDEDDDDDGISDKNEIWRGSDPLNAASTPEHYIFDPNTCLDGIDNDLDSWVDGDDFGCPIRTAPPPSNDNFAAAIAVPTVPFVDIKNTYNATIEPGEPIRCGGVGKTVWYTFTAADDITLAVDVGYSNVVSIYTGGSLSQLALLACGGATPLRVSTGTTVYLQVDSTSESERHVYLSLYLDRDGDGSPDGLDNCPNTSNPAQADTDGDGLGDACDPTPDHDLSIIATSTSALSIKSSDGATGALTASRTGTLTASIKVLNSRSHYDLVWFESSFLQSPEGCEITSVQGNRPGLVAPLRTTRLVVRIHVSCDLDPDAAPGGQPLHLRTRVLPWPSGKNSHYASDDWLNKTTVHIR